MSILTTTGGRRVLGHDRGDLDAPSRVTVPDGRWITVQTWDPMVWHEGATTVVVPGMRCPAEGTGWQPSPPHRRT